MAPHIDDSPQPPQAEIPQGAPQGLPQGGPPPGPPGIQSREGPPRLNLPTPPKQFADWEQHQVIIVGGGPVGLWLGLKLAKRGIEVLVLEGGNELSQSPRALIYMPIVLNEFDKEGILEDVIEAGYKNTEGLCFRTPASKGDVERAFMRDGQRNGAAAEATKSKIDFAGVQLGQPKLAAIILEHAQKLPNFQIRFGHRVQGVHEQPGLNAVDIIASTNEGEKYFRAPFVVGADGAASSVRRALAIPYEGFTWDDFRFVAINILYDFPYPPANHVIDPVDWAVIAKAGKEPNLWRISTGMPAGITDEELHAQIPAKLERLLPGPRPLQYKLEAVSPYAAHERVAATYRRGRVVLAGDAAHANNPLTGLGLTTGLLDIPSLTAALETALKATDNSWEAALEHYAQKRRSAFINFTQPEAITGKWRIHSMEPEVIKMREGFFYMLNNDPNFQQMIVAQMAKVLDI